MRALKPDRERMRQAQRDWMRNRRRDFLAGLTCELCPSTDRLEIHHRDRANKVSHRIWSWTLERRRAELAKCQILCFSCHKLETSLQLNETCAWGACISFDARRSTFRVRMEGRTFGYFKGHPEALALRDKIAPQFAGLPHRFYNLPHSPDSPNFIPQEADACQPMTASL
jgi:hypothetical protein